MSESSSPPTAEPVTPEKGGGFFQNLIDVWFAPREAFGRIVAHPSWVLPFIGHILLALTFTGVFLDNMEPEEFMKVQLQNGGQWEKLTPEQRAGAIEQQSQFIPVISWVSAVVFGPIMLVVLAAVLLFVYRFFYAGEVGFKQAWAIVCWAFFAFGVVTTPMTLGVMALKDDWNINPQDAIQANPSLFLDRAETARPLWALVSSFDLLSFWLIFLLASGFAVACRKSTGSAIWGVVLPWALIVAIKVGSAALF